MGATTVLALAMGTLMLLFLLREGWIRFRRWCRKKLGPDPWLEAQIRRPPVVRYGGFDPNLRERTAVRRQQADRLTRAAAKVASSPGSPPDGRLHVVGSSRTTS